MSECTIKWQERSSHSKFFIKIISGFFYFIIKKSVVRPSTKKRRNKKQRLGYENQYIFLRIENPIGHLL